MAKNIDCLLNQVRTIFSRCERKARAKYLGVCMQRAACCSGKAERRGWPYCRLEFIGVRKSLFYTFIVRFFIHSSVYMIECALFHMHKLQTHIYDFPTQPSRSALSFCGILCLWALKQFSAHRYQTDTTRPTNTINARKHSLPVSDSFQQLCTFASTAQEKLRMRKLSVIHFSPNICT